MDSVFEIAKPNIRVNGQNFEEISENDEGATRPYIIPPGYSPFIRKEIEPFDEALDRHIWSLSDQRLKWDRMMARTRVERPREVEAMLQDLFDCQQDAAAQDVEVAVDDADNFDDLSMFMFTCLPLTMIKQSIAFARLPDIEQAFLKTSSMAEELNQATSLADCLQIALIPNFNSLYQFSLKEQDR